ncbi:hypothetical protein A6J66_008505 [Yersinia enterocolitica]|nr:hypothetical protein A6J66_008505 [Yersinia enterocolitica]
MYHLANLLFIYTVIAERNSIGFLAVEWELIVFQRFRGQIEYITEYITKGFHYIMIYISSGYIIYFIIVNVESRLLIFI